ncbi:MAG TPA: DUF4384 domain-containing protein [Spirochaetota bacterium]|nr:DUF4384 domain-containing protein [Spirochaetota bacterium]
MNRVFFVLLLLAAVFCIQDNHSSAASRKLNIGIASSDVSVYGEMTSLLSKSSYLQLIERRDLGPLFKELELAQSGAVLGASDSRLKGIDYLIMVDKSEHQYYCRIVKVETGEIIVNFDGFISDIAMNCRERLETEISLKSLDSLKNPKGISISIIPSADSYKTGEKIEFSVISEDSDGYLYILDRQPDGSVVILLPNGHKKEYKIQEGEKVTIPGDLGFSIKASEPVGIDKLIVIVTKKPINIFKFGLNAGENYTEVNDKSKEALSRGMTLELDKLPDSEWGISFKEIPIKK